MTSALFTPATLRGLTVDNRIVVGPMDQYSAADGCASDWHLMHLGRYAVSGVGMIITEAAAVERRGRITHGCLGLYSDENEAALDRVVRFCREHGRAKLGIQIAHAGRKGSTRMPAAGGAQSRAPEFLAPEEDAWETVGCAGVPRAPGWPTPRALDEAGLERMIAAHADTTRRAARIGFDLLELVMSHGYLLHEFLSPLSNRRTDAFGGSDLENRMRFPLAVFTAVREAWPADRPLGVRISATDWVEGGWNPEESVTLCRRLRDMGCDFVAVSTGGLSLEQKIAVSEGHQVEFSALIRRRAEIATMTTGMIFDPHHAERIVAEGDADFVCIARGMLSDPHWAWRAAAALDADIPFPRQYVRGYRSKWHRAQRGKSG
ncbi:MAG: NADH:flavin oxidoreductase/NADH oxidase [Alphaproteobacteria bacterium]